MAIVNYNKTTLSYVTLPKDCCENAHQIFFWYSLLPNVPNFYFLYYEKTSDCAIPLMQLDLAKSISYLNIVIINYTLNK